MDLHPKQWRNQHESEQQQRKQTSAKIPKLHLEPSHHQQQHSSGCSALPLFFHEPDSKISSSNLSAVPDSTTRFPRMGSYFSLAQWQELELQALIYRYMLAGAAVPPELLQTIKKSLLQSPTYFLHHPLRHYSHYQPALLQSGYWGRAAMDPEPGRCRRTDGKKWRCSRDVMTGQKYCERHVHRGRNRSRKPVEMPTSTSTRTTTTTISTNNNVTAPFAGASRATGVAAIGCGALKASSPNRLNNFGLSGPSPSIDLLHFNHSSSESKNDHMGLFEAQKEADDRSDGHILRHFFDDWPRSLQEPDNAGRTTAIPRNSATCLSISMPGNSSSDVLLKLSTCNEDQPACRDGERDQPQLNWAAGWPSNQVASMGGPLAEALRSSASNSSPTSVLHQLPRGSASETSYVST